MSHARFAFALLLGVLNLFSVRLFVPMFGPYYGPLASLATLALWLVVCRPLLSRDGT